MFIPNFIYFGSMYVSDSLLVCLGFGSVCVPSLGWDRIEELWEVTGVPAGSNLGRVDPEIKILHILMPVDPWVTFLFCGTLTELDNRNKVSVSTEHLFVCAGDANGDLFFLASYWIVFVLQWKANIWLSDGMWSSSSWNNLYFCVIYPFHIDISIIFYFSIWTDL